MAPKDISLPLSLSFKAQPYGFSFPTRKTALLVIDMQRDFLLEGGFGEIQGGSLEAVQAAIAPNKELLQIFRQLGLPVYHTREGHKPDLSDCPSSKRVRQAAAPDNHQHEKVIGDKGEMGRLLVRGEYGHDIVDELRPLPDEVVIDKPGKGAFWNTSLMDKLKAKGITHLIVSGVTSECCFATTIREANDRGFECCGITEATAGYNNKFKESSLDMIHWSQGLFGFIGDLEPLLDAFAPYLPTLTASSNRTPPQTPPAFNGDLTVSALQKSYREGLSPVTVVEAILDKVEKYSEVDPAVWIYRESESTVLEKARQIQAQWPDSHARPPLFGIPFSVKDSIDMVGIPTTTACPPLSHFPSQTAPCVDLVLSQGAIFIGKTNLDQLATGLTGCRSPHGYPRSVFHKDYISGGSSSGNCVSVGAKLVSFSLATDTAGSGRVPSAFNGVVGFKPTRGLISAIGVTPACLSLDCVAIISHTVAEARLVWDLTTSFDPSDRYAKRGPTPIPRHINSIGPESHTFTFGIPPPSALQICTPIYAAQFARTVSTLLSIGGTLRPIDWNPFDKAGQLLYEGSFVSERLASLPDDFLARYADALHPTIASIFQTVTARESTAVQAYRDLQAKALYTRQAEEVFIPYAGAGTGNASHGGAGVDVVVVPTVPTHPTFTEVESSPIATNSLLGTFTHCGNVLDLCAVAVPAGTYSIDEGNEGDEKHEKVVGGKTGGTRLPFGITFLGVARSDAEVLGIAERFEEAIRTG